MKKLFFIFFLISIPSISSAQVWVTAGYGLSWMNSGGADFVVDQYNGTRNYLTKDLDKPGTFKGAAISGGFNFVGVQMDVGYTFRSAQLTSEGNVSGTSFKRDVDLNYDSFRFGFGLGSFNNSFGYSVGVSVEIIRPSMVTRITNSPEQEINISDFSTSFTPQILLVIGLSEDIPLGFIIRPYYTIGIGEIDYSAFNETINPSTYQNDPVEKQKSKINGFGIEVQFGLLMDLGF